MNIPAFSPIITCGEFKISLRPHSQFTCAISSTDEGRVHFLPVGIHYDVEKTLEFIGG